MRRNAFTLAYCELAGGGFTDHPAARELPLLERPFVLGHFDCWGLVMSYYRQTHGIELHDYRVDYPGGKTTIRTTSIRIAGMSADFVNSTGRRNQAIW